MYAIRSYYGTPDLKEATRVDLNTLTKEQVAAWKPGQKLLLNQFLLLAAVLFSIGVYGVIVRKNGVP